MRGQKNIELKINILIQNENNGGVAHKKFGTMEHVLPLVNQVNQL